MKNITRLGLIAAAAIALAVPTAASAEEVCVYIGTFPECISLGHTR